MTETEGMLVNISEKLIRVLPPAFLLMIVLNIVFLGMNYWVFSHNADARNVLLTKIIDTCLQKQGTNG